MAERRIRDWIKMIFLCAYMREGWRFKETAPDASVEMLWSGTLCSVVAFVNSPQKYTVITDAVPGRRGIRVRPHEVDPEGRLARRLRDLREVGRRGSGSGGRLPALAGFVFLKTRGVPVFFSGG